MNDKTSAMYDCQTDPAKILAFNYYSYMRYRSKVEKINHNLKPKFYLYLITMKTENIFGVINDGKIIIRDEQNPIAFDNWSKKHNKELI